MFDIGDFVWCYDAKRKSGAFGELNAYGRECESFWISGDSYTYGPEAIWYYREHEIYVAPTLIKLLMGIEDGQ